MKTRKVICSVWGLCALAFIAVSCTGDEMENTTGDEHGEPMNFEVTTGIKWNTPGPGWNTANSAPEDGTRAANAIPEQTLTLRGKKTLERLYMSRIVSDWEDVFPGSQQQVLTRGKIVRDKSQFYPSFGLLARIYRGTDPDPDRLPNYLDDIEIKDRGENVWTSDYTIYWPGKGWNIRMLAYAPYKADGVTFDENNTYNIKYKTPEDAEKQTDVMYSLSDEQPGDYNQPFEFKFEHILTAVRFVAGDGMSPELLDSVKITQIVGSGRYIINNKKSLWIPAYTDLITLSSKFGYDKFDTPNGEESIWVATFMVMPQVPSEGGVIEIKRTSGEVLTGKFRDDIWEQSVINTYYITRKEPELPE